MSCDSNWDNMAHQRRKCKYSEWDIKKTIIIASAKLGCEELRLKQLQALHSFLKGHDAFVCLSTGSGKSLCYCSLLIAYDCLDGGSCESIVIVVSS